MISKFILGASYCKYKNEKSPNGDLSQTFSCIELT